MVSKETLVSRDPLAPLEGPDPRDPKERTGAKETVELREMSDQL